MKLEHSLVTLLGVALMLVACFPDIDYRPGDGGGATGAGTGGIGAGGAAGGSGGQTSTSGGGGSGGAPTCTPGDIGVCGGGMKCTIVDHQSGAIGCGGAGPLSRWHRCDGDADCADGLWCDPVLGSCKPFCGNISDCQLDGFNGACVAVQRANGSAIPGATKACRSNCEPKLAAPCNTADLTCIYVVSDTRFDCAKSLKFTENTPCAGASDCGVGMLCAEDSPGSGVFVCLNWCTDGPQDCTLSNPFCYGINPEISWESTLMGVCGPF